MSIRDSFSKLEKHSHGCSCEGDTACHGHGDEDYDLTAGSEELLDKVLLVRILVSAVLFALALILNIPETAKLIMLIAAALVSGYDIYIGAVVNLFQKRLLDECLIMAVASIAAFIIGEDHEGAAVMLLYQIGELLQNYAVNRTRRSVDELMNLRLYSATLVTDEGEKSVHTNDVKPGDIILVATGERVPVDCSITEGSSMLDLSSITGDPEPQPVSEGASILSGAVNLGPAFKAEATALASDSTAARIVDMVENESEDQGKTEKFITKFARVYTPIVLALAVIVAVGEPFLYHISFAESVRRALVFIVVACPCALVISVPLSYFAGIGGASRLGILFKSAMAVDAVAKTKAVVFDKTGTLTTGKFHVSAVKSEKMDAEMLLKIAAHAEAYSSSSVAKAIISAYGGVIYIELIQNFSETPDKGISVTVDNIPIILGSEAFLLEQGVDIGLDAGMEKAVYMAVSGIYAGRICLEDSVRADSAEAVRDLNEAGGSSITMVTADTDPSSGEVARSVGISEFYTGCLPDDKIAHLQEIKSRVGEHGTLIFVGDGEENAAADVNVSMGGLSDDHAVRSADVVIMDDKPTKVAAAIHAARSMRRIVYENVAFIFAIKIVVLVLGFFGISAVWFAVFADVGVALAASLNSIRAYYVRMPKTK